MSVNTDKTYYKSSGSAEVNSKLYALHLRLTMITMIAYDQDMNNWTSDEIKAFRKSLGLTQTTFGKLVGVTRVHIYYLEKGVKKPGKTLRLLFDCIEKGRRKESKKPNGKGDL